MPDFKQLPGESASSFAQLLIHRDAGPARLYRQTAVVTNCSESTLRRRAERWDWEKRLEEYDAGMLRQIELQSTAEGLQRYKQQLKEFRDTQLDRAHRLGRLADDLMELVHRSIMHYQEQDSVLQGREIPAVLSSSCKAMDASITTEATALGVTELLEEYID